MSIFLTKDSKVIVQGMTGSEGTKHTTRMLASGTNIVGGVNTRKAGQSQDFDGKAVPVFRPVAGAVWTQGKRFGTIGCTFGGRRYEITTHRAEAYRPDSRKPEVSFGDDVETDLSRRDFTVNAMATYLRAHKEEPFLLPSVAAGLGTAFFTIIVVRYLGPEFAFAGFLASTVLSFPWFAAIYRRKRRHWEELEVAVEWAVQEQD